MVHQIVTSGFWAFLQCDLQLGLLVTWLSSGPSCNVAFIGAFLNVACMWVFLNVACIWTKDG